MRKFSSSWEIRKPSSNLSYRRPLREPPVSLTTVQRWFKTLDKGTFKDQKGHRPFRPVVTTLARNILRVKRLFKKNPKQSVRMFHQAYPSHRQRFVGSSWTIWNSGTLFPYRCPIISVTTTNVGKWSAVRVY